MAIQLYKPGKDHERNGVKFDLINTNIGSLDHYLKDGWFKTIGEWLKEPESKETKPDENLNQNKSAGNSSSKKTNQR